MIMMSVSTAGRREATVQDLRTVLTTTASSTA